MIASLKRAVSATSRERKIREFFSLCPEGARILDVGVSGNVLIADTELNRFLTTYPRDPSTYTGLAVEDITQLRRAFPQFRFVQYPGGVMPFKTGEFDWAFSNAVIEHVGGEIEQQFFVDEMLRVARAVYFTTPNRWFPVETHSGQIFRHWNRQLFDRWAHRKGYSWLTAAELRLLGYRDLQTIMRHSRATDYRIRRNWLPGIPWPMTFSVIARS